jgi:hypothetical protein
MARVVRPGGLVTAYAWDMPGGGFPYHALREEIHELGGTVPLLPSPNASRLDALQDLWTGAGLTAVDTRVMTVARTFADFDDYWTTILGGPSVRAALATMTPEQIALVNARMRKRLSSDAAGRITYPACANAITGRVPSSKR